MPLETTSGLAAGRGQRRTMSASFRRKELQLILWMAMVLPCSSWGQEPLLVPDVSVDWQSLKHGNAAHYRMSELKPLTQYEILISYPASVSVHIPSCVACVLVACAGNSEPDFNQDKICGRLKATHGPELWRVSRSAIFPSVCEVCLVTYPCSAALFFHVQCVLWRLYTCAITSAFFLVCILSSKGRGKNQVRGI